MSNLKAPFPWFGGKSSVIDLVWERFGAVQNYVEPFFGSGAMLLGAPWPADRIETVNDLDGMVANFWRALTADPEAVAEFADWPVNEVDLHPRHAWLVEQKAELSERLMGDPEYYDVKIAGWWCWGICCWIGSGFCSGDGPWVRQQQENGEWRLVNTGDKGQGVNRKLVHLGSKGQGVNRKLVGGDALREWFGALADRLARVRVCCGDWSRVCGPTPTVMMGISGVFLDPPYSAEAGRDENIYASEDLTVAHAVREWALEWGNDKRMRIALCGYEDEHEMPQDWECVEWKAHGGYGNEARDSDAVGRENSKRERIWFSPHCQAAKQRRMF